MIRRIRSVQARVKESASARQVFEAVRDSLIEPAKAMDQEETDAMNKTPAEAMDQEETDAMNKTPAEAMDLESDAMNTTPAEAMGLDVTDAMNTTPAETTDLEEADTRAEINELFEGFLSHDEA